MPHAIGCHQEGGCKHHVHQPEKQVGEEGTNHIVILFTVYGLQFTDDYFYRQIRLYYRQIRLYYRQIRLYYRQLSGRAR
jgi:hypothetical protein